MKFFDCVLGRGLEVWKVSIASMVSHLRSPILSAMEGGAGIGYKLAEGEDMICITQYEGEWTW